MDDKQRREFHEALLDAINFEDLPGKWQAAILKAEQNRPKLRLVTGDYRPLTWKTPLFAWLSCGPWRARTSTLMMRSGTVKAGTLRSVSHATHPARSAL